MSDTGSVHCGYCGMIHVGQVCPRVKAIEYHPDGVTVKRVEFHGPQPVSATPIFGPGPNMWRDR